MSRNNNNINNNMATNWDTLHIINQYIEEEIAQQKSQQNKERDAYNLLMHHFSEKYLAKVKDFPKVKFQGVYNSILRRAYVAVANSYDSVAGTNVNVFFKLTQLPIERFKPDGLVRVTVEHSYGNAIGACAALLVTIALPYGNFAPTIRKLAARMGASLKGYDDRIVESAWDMFVTTASELLKDDMMNWFVDLVGASHASHISARVATHTNRARSEVKHVTIDFLK